MSAGKCRNDHDLDELGRNGRGECVACVRAAVARYRSTDKGKANQARYQLTDKGRATKARYRQRLREARA